MKKIYQRIQEQVPFFTSLSVDRQLKTSITASVSSTGCYTYIVQACDKIFMFFLFLEWRHFFQTSFFGHGSFRMGNFLRCTRTKLQSIDPDRELASDIRRMSTTKEQECNSKLKKKHKIFNKFKKFYSLFILNQSHCQLLNTINFFLVSQSRIKA